MNKKSLAIKLTKSQITQILQDIGHEFHKQVVMVTM